jgi:metal-responsive CopG/Arc/MetJ family transcriptional regulator
MASDRRGPKGGETTKTPGGLQRVAVLLTEEQYEALRRLAYERQASQSEIVREALDDYLDRERRGQK